MRQTDVTAANTDLAPESELTSYTNIFENEVTKKFVINFATLQLSYPKF